MLSSTIVKLAVSAELDSVETARLAQCIYRYALNLCKAKDLKNIGAEFRIIRPLLEYKKTHLDNTHYILSRFWRAAYLIQLQQRSCMYCIADCKEQICEKFKWDFKAVANTYNITYQDLKYVSDNNIIVEADMAFIESRSKSLELPNPEIVGKVISKLKNYIRSRVNRKLSFIYNYQNLDPEDFVSDIAAAVAQSLIANDYLPAGSEKDQEKLLIIAKRIIKQEVCNIISKYTAQKRNRLVSTDGGYESTTLSLDSTYEDESPATNLHNVVTQASVSSTTMSALLKRIKQRSTPDECLFLDIKLGKVLPKELMTHALQRSGKSLDALRTSTADRTIFDYLGWSNKRVKEFRSKVRTILEEL